MPTCEHTLTATSPATASTAASTEVLVNLERYERITIDLDVQGATGGTLDIVVQRYAGGQWRDWFRLAQLAAGASAAHYTYTPAANQAATAVGVGTTPVIAANTWLGGYQGGRLRFLFVAGAGTSAGASQSMVVTGWRR